MSPTSIFSALFQTTRMSPRLKAGSIDSEMTTTSGEEEFVIVRRACHAMKAEEMIRQNVIACSKAGRGPDMVKRELEGGVMRERKEMRLGTREEFGSHTMQTYLVASNL
jgi:hypothetical protein